MSLYTLGIVINLSKKSIILIDKYRKFHGIRTRKVAFNRMIMSLPLEELTAVSSQENTFETRELKPLWSGYELEKLKPLA